MTDPREPSVSSPAVGRHAWGVTEVEGIGTFKDVKLWPGGAREWDWNETGTRHRPGIQPADVAELVAQGVEVVVLSRGRELQLETMPEVLALLDAHGIRVVHVETSEAIDAYNRLAVQGVRVAALIHSTC